MDYVLIGGGAALIGLAIWDQFWTILGEGGGPLTRRVAGWCWRGARRLYAVWPSSRLLSVAGGLTIVCTLLLWMALLWAGWGLLFVAAGGALVDTATGEPASLGTRIYYSGYVLSTLGVGDVQAHTDLWRMLTALASINGLFQISFSVAYLIPVIVAATEKRHLAVLVSTIGESAQDVVLNAWDGEDLHALSTTLDDIASDLALLEQRHRTYPVLHYAHSLKRAAAIGPSLVNLDEALTIVVHGLQDRDDVIDQVGFRTVRRTLSTYLETLATVYGNWADAAPPVPSLDRLREAGVPVVEQDAFADALEALADRRRSLLTLLRAEGWTWDAVTSPDTEGEETRKSLYETYDL